MSGSFDLLVIIEGKSLKDVANFVATRPCPGTEALVEAARRGFVIMELLKMLIPVVLPVPFSLYFDIFDGLIQAYVFVFLTSLFIKEAVE